MSDVAAASADTKWESHDAPLHVGAISLVVRDLAAVTRFYEHVVGLDVILSTPERSELGMGREKLLILDGRPNAQPEPATSPGLFHTAFVLPTRPALGRWLVRAFAAGLELSGASDHQVSEALYFDDPESNGIEVYADRPRGQWDRDGSQYRMTTERLDVRQLLAAGEASSEAHVGRDADLRVGHVHLRASNLDKSEVFYREILGANLTHARPGARWFGFGGYHHHVATNVWRSNGAPPRAAGWTGLSSYSLVASSEQVLQDMRGRLSAASMPFDIDGNNLSVRDPSGIEVHVTASKQ